MGKIFMAQRPPVGTVNGIIAHAHGAAGVDGSAWIGMPIRWLLMRWRKPRFVVAIVDPVDRFDILVGYLLKTVRSVWGRVSYRYEAVTPGPSSMRAIDIA